MPTGRMSRRRMILGGLAVLASLTLLPRLRLVASATAAKKELRVFNYSYYIDPRVISWFEEETGLRVIYDEYESGEEALAKLEVGGGGYDVIILPSEYLSSVIARGLVREIDRSRVPNLAYVDDVFFTNPHDPGLRYSVPYLGGTTGLGVNVRRVAEGVSSWGTVLEDFSFLERYKKRVSMIEEFTEVFGTVLLYLGYDPSKLENWNMEMGRKIADILIKQKPYIAGYYGASVYIPQLVNERLYVAHAWSGDVAFASKENPVVEYVIPEEGGLRWNDFAVIPRDARNVDGAYLWINYMLNPVVSAVNVAYTFYVSPLKPSVLKQGLERAFSEGLIDVEPEKILSNTAVNPPPNIARRIRFYAPVTEEVIRVVEETRKMVLAEVLPSAYVIAGAAIAVAAGIGGLAYARLRRKRV